MKIFKESKVIGVGRLFDRKRDIIQFSVVRIEDIIHPKTFQFEVRGESGLWEFKNYPVMFHTDGCTILSTYGPCTPIPEGFVEAHRI